MPLYEIAPRRDLYVQGNYSDTQTDTSNHFDTVSNGKSNTVDQGSVIMIHLLLAGVVVALFMFGSVIIYIVKAHRAQQPRDLSTRIGWEEAAMQDFTRTRMSSSNQGSWVSPSNQGSWVSPSNQGSGGLSGLSRVLPSLHRTVRLWNSESSLRATQNSS